MIGSQRNKELLERTLAAFDRHHARRRERRESAALAATLLAVVVLVWSGPARVMPPLVPGPPTRQPLVTLEQIEGDDSLAEALASAGSCIGFGRRGGNLFVVPCEGQIHLPRIE